MILSIIVAQASNRAIGKDNDLLWHLPSDLKRFKALTTGHTILMGRKTFESLPKGALPNRRNVVVSRSVEQIEGAEVYPSLETALSALSDQDEVFVIGGGEIYEQTLPLAQRLYLTEVHAIYPDAHTFFPPIHADEWQELERIEQEQDERHVHSYTYRLLEKIP